MIEYKQPEPAQNKNNAQAKASESKPLLACPFCGEIPNVIKYDDDGITVFYISCQNKIKCGHKGRIWGNEQLAIDAWNQRSG